MNLSDLIARKDRSVLTEGRVETASVHCAGATERAVTLASNTCLRLRRADEFWALRSFPSDLGLTLVRSEQYGGTQGDFAVQLIYQNERAILWQGSGAEQAERLHLDWPLPGPAGRPFDLEFVNHSGPTVALCHGRPRNLGLELLPLLVGSGVEVGPGAYPFLRPSPERDVRYVEQKTAAEWQAVYAKGDLAEVDQKLWERYETGDARTLDSLKDASLDFIFSKHVLEHLINPIGVMERWARVLKPGGVIAGTVPDLRYTFDLRQEPTRLGRLAADYEAGVSSIPMDRYEQWCRFTAPYNTPQDLIRRDYAIHVSYFTVESFIVFLQAVVDACPTLTHFALKTEQNNKDFAFALWKE